VSLPTLATWLVTFHSLGRKGLRFQLIFHRYVDYVRHLWTSRPPLDDTQAFESPFYDYLQIPLQPLADNLESNTYEVFEQDPVK
jgi:hypothetical protein